MPHDHTSTRFFQDSSYTHVPVLEAIARSSATAATMALTNRNITGATYAQLVATADLSVEGIRTAGPRLLIAGRDAADVVTLARATAARSPRAVELLVKHCDPEGLLALLTMSRAEQFRGRAAVIEAVTESALLSARSQSDHPRYAELIDDIIETHLRSGQPVTATHLAARAAGRTTLEGLRSLAPELAEVAGSPPGAVLDELLLTTWDHPEAARHWATHGGALGALVAAGDNRLDADLLASLPDRVPARLREACRARVENNPAAPQEDRRALLLETIADIFDDTCPDNAAVRRERFREWTLQAAQAIDNPGGTAVGTVSTWTNAHELDRLDVLNQSFLAVCVAVNPAAPNTKCQTAISSLFNAWLPANVLRALAHACDSRDITISASMQRRCDHAKPAATGADAVSDEQARRTVASVAMHQPIDENGSHPAASYLNGRITTPAQLEAVYDLLDTTHNRRDLYAVVADAQRAAPIPVPARIAAYSGLVGNALGTLD